MILPFGSNDADVIAYTDFSSEANINAAGGTVHGAPTLSDKGLLCNNVGDYVEFLNLDGHIDAAWAGQLSVGVMTKDIATDDIDAPTITDYNSNNGPSSQGYILASTSNGGGWNNGLSIVGGDVANVDARLSLNAKTGTTVAGRGVFYHPSVVSDISVATISWVGRSFNYIINGTPAGSHSNASRPTANDWLYKILIGKRGIGGSEYLNRYITGFQLAKRPIENASIPLLIKTVIFGDSYSNSNTGFVNSYGYQAGKIQQMQRVLLGKGISLGQVVPLSQPGNDVQDNGADPLEADRYLVANEDPSLIIFQAGRNDSGIFDSPTFDTDIKDHITYFVNNCSHLKGIIIGTLPYSPQDTTTPDFVNSVNSIIKDLPTWFNQTFPGMAGKLVVAEVAQKFEGLTDPSIGFGLADVVHPSAIGMYLMGEAWGEAILQVAA